MYTEIIHTEYFKIIEENKQHAFFKMILYEYKQLRHAVVNGREKWSSLTLRAVLYRYKLRYAVVNGREERHSLTLRAVLYGYKEPRHAVVNGREERRSLTLRAVLYGYKEPRHAVVNGREEGQVGVFVIH